MNSGTLQMNPYGVLGEISSEISKENSEGISEKCIKGSHESFGKSFKESLEVFLSKKDFESEDEFQRNYNSICRGNSRYFSRIPGSFFLRNRWRNSLTNPWKIFQKNSGAFSEETLEDFLKKPRIIVTLQKKI